MTDGKPSPTDFPIAFRTPRVTDGAAIWRLVQASATLELNSPYFYLIFATHFSDSCLVAEQSRPGREGAEVIGVVLGYRPPREADTAFVWQVGVHPRCQGRGLALRMLAAWKALPALQGCRWLSATVSADNLASTALFRRYAREHGAACEVRPHFTSDLFPGIHEAEPLYRIGPLAQCSEFAA